MATTRAVATAAAADDTTTETNDDDRVNDTTSSKEEEEEDVDELFDRRYSAYFQSIRSTTGLEIGISVTWPAAAAGSSDTSVNTPTTGTRKSSSSSSIRDGACCLQLSTCLSQDCLAPLFHGTQWAGTRIWRASVVALEFLLSVDDATNDECNKKICITRDHNVLELGCGLGVPGMVLHALRDCRVVLTDKADLIPTLQANLDKAFPSLLTEEEDSSSSASRITAHALDWSHPDAVDELLKATGLKQFDVVLNCDCIFEPLYGESWKYLLECQVALLKNNPSSYVLISVERRKFDGIEKYLDALDKAGVGVQPIRPTSFAYPPQVELYRLYLRSHSATTGTTTSRSTSPAQPTTEQSM